MSQIEGNNSVLPDMRSSAQKEPKHNISSDINYDQEHVDIKDVFESLPDNIKEFVKAEVSSLDDLIKALQYLQHPLLSASFSQSDINAVQQLIKQLSAISVQLKDQQAAKSVNSSSPSINDSKDIDITSKASLNEQNISKHGKAELPLTDTEEPFLLKNTGLTTEQANILNKHSLPLNASEHNKALLDAYRNEVKATQTLAEMGTRVTVNGQTVSLHGSQGVLSTDNLAGFLARGEQGFLDNARIAAASEGYNAFDTQQEGEGRNNRQGTDDDKQEKDGDTLFFYEDE